MSDDVVVAFPTPPTPEELEAAMSRHPAGKTRVCRSMTEHPSNGKQKPPTD